MFFCLKTAKNAKSELCKFTYSDVSVFRPRNASGARVRISLLLKSLQNIMIYLFNGIGISSITAYTLWRNIDPIYQTQIEQNFEILTQKS